MSEMGAKFTIVDDSYRDDLDDEMVRALLTGRTLFLPGASNAEVTTLYSRLMKRYNRRLRRRERTIDGTTGFVVFLDAEETEPASEETTQ